MVAYITIAIKQLNAAFTIRGMVFIPKKGATNMNAETLTRIKR